MYGFFTHCIIKIHSSWHVALVHWFKLARVFYHVNISQHIHHLSCWWHLGVSMFCPRMLLQWTSLYLSLCTQVWEFLLVSALEWDFCVLGYFHLEFLAAFLKHNFDEIKFVVAICVQYANLSYQPPHLHFGPSSPVPPARDLFLPPHSPGDNLWAGWATEMFCRPSESGLGEWELPEAKFTQRDAHAGVCVLWALPPENRSPAWAPALVLTLPLSTCACKCRFLPGRPGVRPRGLCRSTRTDCGEKQKRAGRRQNEGGVRIKRRRKKRMTELSLFCSFLIQRANLPK